MQVSKDEEDTRGGDGDVGDGEDTEMGEEEF